MTINEKLVHFKTKQTFNLELNNILDTSIAFIQDANAIYTHNTEYPFVNWSYLIPNTPDGYANFFTSEGIEFHDVNNKTFYVKQ